MGLEKGRLFGHPFSKAWNYFLVILSIKYGPQGKWFKRRASSDEYSVLAMFLEAIPKKDKVLGIHSFRNLPFATYKNSNIAVFVILAKRF